MSLATDIQHLSAAAVVDEAVGGAAAGVLDDWLRELLDALADGSTGDVLHAHEVSSKTANVRSSHGSSREGLGATTGLGGENFLARSIDINY